VLLVRASQIRGMRHGRAFQRRSGLLVAFPTVGNALVLIDLAGGGRTMTSPIRRVLGDPAGNNFYVETSNSVYRITVEGTAEFSTGPDADLRSLSARLDRTRQDRLAPVDGSLIPSSLDG